MKRDELQEFLEQQTRAGRFCSVDHEFSLDLEKAAKKLRSTIPFPEFWVLKWVQGSIVSGASWIQGGRTHNGFYLTSRCEPFTLEELQALSDPSCALGATERKLRQFGAAVQGALALSPSRIEVGSWNGEAQTLVIEDGSTALRTSNDGPPEKGNCWLRLSGVTSRAPGRKESFRARLARVFTLTDATEFVLRSALRMCPVPMIWNNKALNYPLITQLAKIGDRLDIRADLEINGAAYFFDRARSGALPAFPCEHGRKIVWFCGEENDPANWQTLHAAGRSPFSISSKRSLQSELTDVRTLEHLWCDSEQFKACKAALQFHPGVRSKITFVQDGVCSHTAPLGGRNIVMFISADDLRTDLGGLALVNDQALTDTYDFAHSFLEARIRHYRLWR